MACLYNLVGGNLSVFQGYHDRGGLEGGSRLHHIGYGIVAYFAIHSVVAFGHVYNGFHFAGLYFHQDGYTYIGVDFFQLVDQCFLGDILHAHIDSGYDVASVYGCNVYYVQVFVHYLLAVGNAVFTPQNGVVRQFQSILCAQFYIRIHVAQRTHGQRAEWFFPLVEGLFMETSTIFVHIEHRQCFCFLILYIGDSLGVKQVVAASFFASLQDVVLEFLGALVGENLIQSLADGIQVVHQE